MIFRSFLISTLVFLLFYGFAQDKKATYESMVWIEAIEKLNINDRWSATILWHHRIFFDRAQTYQDIRWLSLSRSVSPSVSLTGGIVYFTQHRLLFDEYSTVPEWRPFQGLTYSKRVGDVKTSLRCYVEQRFTKKVVNEVGQKKYNFSLRWRSRLQAIVPIHRRMKLELSEEILIRNVQNENSAFDQNRARVRLFFYPGGERFSIHLGYLNWVVNRSSEVQYRHAILIGARHIFNAP